MMLLLIHCRFLCTAQLIKSTFISQQLMIVSLLNNSSSIQHINIIGFGYSLDFMGHHQYKWDIQTVYSRLNLFLIPSIQC